jgi:hypothetical protein
MLLKGLRHETDLLLFKSYIFKILGVHKEVLLYRTVDFATAASQNGACMTQENEI